MRDKTTLDEFIEALEGRAGQPIVLGVCRTLSARWGIDRWKIRLAAIVLALFFTVLTVAAYIVLGLVLPETSARTRGVFKGLGLVLQEWWQKIERVLGCEGMMNGGIDDGTGASDDHRRRRGRGQQWHGGDWA